MNLPSTPYQDYSGPQFQNKHCYTEDECALMFQVIVELVMDINETSLIDEWRAQMNEHIKHLHSKSVFGDYCKFCGCDLGEDQ